MAPASSSSWGWHGFSRQGVCCGGAGTDRSIPVVGRICQEIEWLGGGVRVETTVETVRRGASGKEMGVSLRGGEEIKTDHVVLAVGDSLRETLPC